MVAGLVADRDVDLNRLRTIGDGLAEDAVGPHVHREVDGAVPDVERLRNAGELEWVRGLTLGGVVAEAVGTVDCDRGSDHPVRDRVVVNVEPLGHGDPKNQPPTGAGTKDASTAPQEGGHRDAVILGCGREWVADPWQYPAGVAVEDGLDPVAVGEVSVEEFVDDHAVLVEEEEAGERHAIERHVLGLHDRVEDLVLPDHDRVDVGQERELDT